MRVLELLMMLDQQLQSSKKVTVWLSQLSLPAVHVPTAKEGSGHAVIPQTRVNSKLNCMVTILELFLDSVTQWVDTMDAKLNM